jgi:hypothetical protein
MARTETPPTRPVVVEGVLTSAPLIALSRFEQPWLSAHVRGVDRREHPAYFWVLAYDATAGRARQGGVQRDGRVRRHPRVTATRPSRA